ncbi:Adenosylcobinamide-GDP ribazoletransferase [compost metagenome]
MRASGLGQALAEQLPRRRLPWVLAAHGVAVLLFGCSGLLAILVAGGLFVWLRKLMLVRLGGTTGDTAGAMLELLECGIVLALALFEPL